MGVVGFPTYPREEPHRRGHYVRLFLLLVGGFVRRAVPPGGGGGWVFGIPFRLYRAPLVHDWLSSVCLFYLQTLGSYRMSFSADAMVFTDPFLSTTLAKWASVA